MIISAIVAISADYGIGLNNQLLWHLPDDLRFFKRMTKGKPVIMGRKTHESIGRPLPRRTNIILTRNKSYTAEGCIVVHSVAEAFEAAGDVEEVVIMGGDQIYRLFLPYTNRLYITYVDATLEADTYFPKWESAEWIESSREHHPTDEKHIYPFDWVIYDHIPKQDREGR